MKLAQLAMAIATVAISATTFAGTITGSSNMTFLAFDGQKLKKKEGLAVNDTAPHQIVVEVSTIYQSGSDNHFFESSPIVLTFNGSSEDIQVIAPNLRSARDVEKFKEDPTFTIKTLSGQQLEYKKDYLKGEGFMPNANIEGNLAQYNRSNGVAAVKSLAVSPMVAVMPAQNTKAVKGKVMVQGENIAEQQLQYWFQQADSSTQKRFLEWAKKR